MVKSDEDKSDNVGDGDKSNYNNINDNNNNINNNINNNKNNNINYNSNNINNNHNNHYGTKTRADQIEYREKNFLKCCLLYVNNNLYIY